MSSETDDQLKGSINPYAVPEQLPAETNESLMPSQPDVGRWLVIYAVAGCGLGAISRIVRPMVPGPVHFEAIVSGTLMLFLCAGAAVRFATANPFTWKRMGVVSLVIVAAWIGYTAGWSLVHGSIWDDMVAGSAIGIAISSALMVAVFAIIALIARLGSSSALDSR